MPKERTLPTEPEAKREEPVQQVVIDKKTGRVKRAGFCDFSSDGSHKPQDEVILHAGRDFDHFQGDVQDTDWHYKDGAFVGTTKPAARAPGPILESPDGTRWELTINNGGTLSAVKV